MIKNSIKAPKKALFLTLVCLSSATTFFSSSSFSSAMAGSMADFNDGPSIVTIGEPSKNPLGETVLRGRIGMSEEPNPIDNTATTGSIIQSTKATKVVKKHDDKSIFQRLKDALTGE